MKNIRDIIPKNMRIPLILTLLVNALAYYGTRLFMSDKFHYNLSNPIDDAIPVVPVFVVIYWGCYLFWGINYIIGCRQDEEEAYKFICADFLAKIVCFIVFIVLPTTNTRPALEGTDIFTNWIRVLYKVDAADNLFPSIHCLTSWFCYISVRKNDKIGKWYKIASFVITALICISTLTTKQHVIFDVIGGIVLSEGSYQLVKYTGVWKVYRRCVDSWTRIWGNVLRFTQS